MRPNNKITVAKSSKIYFESGMKGHSAVSLIISLGENTFLIKRTEGRSDLKILVADIYIAGEADILEINPNSHSIDGIVLIGFYNRYSSAAKELARSMNVGLFDNREFYGAVNCTGNAFLNYERKERDN